MPWEERCQNFGQSETQEYIPDFERLDRPLGVIEHKREAGQSVARQSA
jgi:hypothetical protein